VFTAVNKEQDSGWKLKKLTHESIKIYGESRKPFVED